MCEEKILEIFFLNTLIKWFSFFEFLEKNWSLKKTVLIRNIALILSFKKPYYVIRNPY